MKNILTNVSVKAKLDGNDNEYAFNQKQLQSRLNPNEAPPLVLLLGWLGCKPKHLESHTKLYKSMGMTVMTKIAPPSSVVVAAVDFTVAASSSSHAAESPSSSTNSRELVKLPVGTTTMTDVAKSTIDEILKGSKTHSRLVIHIFSNGGTFLWEEMRHILQQKQNMEMRQTLKLSGLIFDSAPGDFSKDPDMLLQAMRYCPPEEKIQLHAYLQERKDVFGEKEDLALRTERARQFWEGLKHCMFPIPHLYIGSKVDPLAPFDTVWELIKYRSSDEFRVGRGSGDIPVPQYAIFEDSKHCSHLMKYEVEYQAFLVAFLNQSVLGYRHTDTSTLPPAATSRL